MIDCLRHGIRDRGVRLRLVYNKPPSTLNKLLMENYRKNIFTVSRQVYYSHQHNNSLDVVLFLNGFPIVVMELKNPLTGQTYEQDRKSTRLNSSHVAISYAVLCLNKQTTSEVRPY